MRDLKENEPENRPSPAVIPDISTIPGKNYQEQAKIFIADEARGQLPHAFLLSGPRRSEKNRFAWDMTRFLLEKDDRQTVTPVEIRENTFFSLEHRAAKLVNALSHPDFFFLAPDYDEKKQKYKSDISIATTRQAIRFLHATPSLTRNRRLIIIEQADCLHHGVANALLKSLEEPVPGTVIFLLCDLPGRVLPTIRSRCRHIAFSALEEDDVERMGDGFTDSLTAASGEDIVALWLKLFKKSIYGPIAKNDLESISSVFYLFHNLMASMPNPDKSQIHKIAQETAASQSSFEAFQWVWASHLVSTGVFALGEGRESGRHNLFCLPSTADPGAIFTLWDISMSAFSETRGAGGIEKAFTVRALFASLLSVMAGKPLESS